MPTRSIKALKLSKYPIIRSKITGEDLEVRHSNTEERVLYHIGKWRNDLNRFLIILPRTFRSAHGLQDKFKLK